jgi:hypothetical protein
VRTFIDTDDDAYGQRIYDAAKEGVVAEISYFATGGQVRKISFVTRIGDQGCGVGYFPK